MRISATYFDNSGAIYSVCSLLSDTNDQAGIDAAVREQWNDPQIASADVITAPGNLIRYAAKP